MINWIKRQLSKIVHLDIYVINLFGLIVGIILYYKLGEKIEIIGACLATTISISVGLRTYKIENDKIFKDLFETFNKIYDEKFNESLNEINDDTKDINEKLIIDYLNFCSEEYLWFKKKRIPYNVWMAWREGILFHLGKKSIRTLVEKEKKQKESYYGLFENLDL